MTADDALRLALELHDSEVAEVRHDPAAEVLAVRFSAAHLHASPGLPGVDDGLAFLQPATLWLEAVADLALDSPPHFGRLTGGALIVDGRPFRGLLPVPLDAAGEITLSLAFSNGASLRAGAGRARIERHGEAAMVGDHRC